MREEFISMLPPGIRTMTIGPGTAFAPANQILRSLPPEDLNRLVPLLELVPLDSKTVLYQPNERIEQVYFPEDSIISIASRMQDGRTIEAGLVGHDGLVGINALMGVSAVPYQYLTLISGKAYRIDAIALSRELKLSGALKDSLLRYTQDRLIQFARIGACNSLHPAIKRVCRWLLMVHDRRKSDRLPLTHETISQILPVRRTGITQAAGILQKKNLISNQYGQITILDRVGLEAAACECYQIMKPSSISIAP